MVFFLAVARKRVDLKNCWKFIQAFCQSPNLALASKLEVPMHYYWRWNTCLRVLARLNQQWNEKCPPWLLTGLKNSPRQAGYFDQEMWLEQCECGSDRRSLLSWACWSDMKADRNSSLEIFSSAFHVDNVVSDIHANQGGFTTPLLITL